MSTDEKRARQSKRSRIRGAVFIEALVVCLLLTICLASGIFFHRLYATKIRALHDARQRVWFAAEQGCASQFGMGQVFNGLILSCTGRNCELSGLGLQTTRPPPWIAVGAEVAEIAHVVHSPTLLGGETYRPHGYNRVICNESRQDERGDLASVAKYMLDAVWPW